MSAPEYWKARAAHFERMAGKSYPGKGHPWADFLYHRARVLRQWRDEGKTPEQSAADMQMDPTQVRLILMTVDQHPDDYAPAPGEKDREP